MAVKRAVKCVCAATFVRVNGNADVLHRANVAIRVRPPDKLWRESNLVSATAIRVTILAVCRASANRARQLAQRQPFRVGLKNSRRNASARPKSGAKKSAPVCFLDRVPYESQIVKPYMVPDKRSSRSPGGRCPLLEQRLQ